MVGDKLLDVECGHNAGGLGVLVRTGYGREEERGWLSASLSERGSAPDAVVDDLEAAAAWYLEAPRAGGSVF